MTDERPRPQYGEYATPEQQEKAAGKNLPQRRFVGPPITPPPPSPPVTAETAPPGLYSQSRHPIDRFFSIFMLGLGAFFLLSSIPNYVDFSTALSLGYGRVGAPAFPDPALANRIGIILLVAHVVLFLVTLVVSVRRLARSRWTFFVPIIGFLAFTIVFTITSFVLWSAEPAYFRDVMVSIQNSL